ncbi:HlyD family efflux transporter periplasmic adaptor subunit [Acinetobacter geminorum]|uniref:HlyD family efflux transporter periplasmic adaptor subunit n=2 Tax=Acinetobacter TaxID=469 RepID=A0ABT8ZBQ7_9GAMM|nr:HlyD family efflux transporter periplasmic adaptor subunit [Acinetobacter geminorum]MDO7362148.1 HlyD family efflux transporter periplasmic adaptor subunit [Acinetobacter geminorum]
MDENNLFRQEAVKAQQTTWLGDVILVRPFSFTLLTLIAALITTIILIFIFLGSYTKRITIEGQLIPNTGVIRVYAPDTGIVVKKLVNEGKHVKQGDELFLLSTTRFNERGDLNQSLLNSIQLRSATLADEKLKMLSIQANENKQLQSQIEEFTAALQKLDGLIKEQRKRVALANSKLERYKSLLKQEFISIDEFQIRQDYLIEQQILLKNYESDQITKKNELNRLKLQLNSLPSKQRNDYLALERQVSSIEQEKIEIEARQSLIIRSQASGIATAVNAEIGQQILVNTPVVNIIPENAILEAHLYLPSQAIGFIKIGQNVKLRYRAFPYQKFGQATGHIFSISDTAMNARDIVNYGEFSSNFSENQAIYLVKVAIDQQSIKAYGIKHPLKVGMVFEADIMQENRKLYEWVLEPLFSISGKL